MMDQEKFNRVKAAVVEDIQRDIEKFGRPKDKKVNPPPRPQFSLTKTLLAHKQFIEQYIAKYNRAPTYEEIADNFGISAAAAWNAVKRLKKRGHIETIPKAARAIRVISE